MKRFSIAVLVFVVGALLLSASLIVSPVLACGDCVPDGNATCPTECGYGGGSVTDNCGKVIQCNPTESCPPNCVPDGTVSCPTECGYEGGTVTDSCGKEIQCNPTGSCPPNCVPDGSAVCTTACGYEGGFIQDNCGNQIECGATEECVVPPPPPTPLPPPPQQKDKPLILSLTGIEKKEEMSNEHNEQCTLFSMTTLEWIILIAVLLVILESNRN